MARKNLTDKGVAALRARAARYSFADPQLVGHYVRVTPNGVRTFVCAARNPAGKQVWVTIGDAGVMPIAESRSRAREYLLRIKDGLPAIAAKGESFDDVIQQWLRRYVRKRGLRSEPEITRLINVHCQDWKDREFLGLRRSDVSRLLDEVEDGHGASEADHLLAVIRGAMNWFATRNDAYVPPIVKGMRRTEPKERQRDRVLTDDEIREVWRVAETGGTFGALVRILLLTAQRRGAVVRMKWSDLDGLGTWTIATEEREKGNAGALILPPAARAIIESQPRFSDNPFVFAGRDDGPINGFSKAKAKFDAKLTGVAPWTLHDLRRTARSLLSRCGVHPHVAERVLGHALAGVEGVYDRHSYAAEKTHALMALANLLDEIVHPSKRDNVTAIPKRARR